jgi:hypothetical protein
MRLNIKKIPTNELEKIARRLRQEAIKRRIKTAKKVELERKRPFEEIRKEDFDNDEWSKYIPSKVSEGIFQRNKPEDWFKKTYPSSKYMDYRTLKKTLRMEFNNPNVRKWVIKRLTEY